MKWKRARTQETIKLKLVEYLAYFGEMPASMHTFKSNLVVDGDENKNYTIASLTDDPAVVVATVYVR